MFPPISAIVLLALVNPISSLEHILSLRNLSLKQTGLDSGSRLLIHGGFDQDGLDSGIPSSMKEVDDGLWEFDMMTEFPSYFKIYSQMVDKKPPSDLSLEPGDLQNLSVLSNSSTFPLLVSIVSLNNYPRSPHIAFKITVNKTAKQYSISAMGSRRYQITVFLLLGILPVLIGFASIRIYMYSFYVVKVNKFGQAQTEKILPLTIQSKMYHRHWLPRTAPWPFGGENLKDLMSTNRALAKPTDAHAVSGRLTILIATMEYLIDDWDIKVDIGGLGVMAQLMSKSLGHQDLVWVVPCVGDIDYPEARRADPITVTIFGTQYIVQVQYHQLGNITYVLLDAPVFRARTKSEPYPSRMDDISSAVYYSAWNSCIAAAIGRFPVDLYHMNDFHGTVAPLHLLPMVIPCCLSLHDAEIQGSWPIRTAQEINELRRVFNLKLEVIRQYVQFGEFFNLLHAGATYLRVWQNGFGVVGVSTKQHSARSFARHPIFWGLKKIITVPYPDPTDTGFLNSDSKIHDKNFITIDSDFEANRPVLRHQAQQWAHLEQDAKAEIFVFVGRWSMQKGIDLIADVFPGILEKHKNTQLICVGPVVDLYGKFAASKLEKLASFYPGRICLRSEVSMVPQYIFGGTEFVLIPSREEPFGAVAVEFGRKGALSIGARVGGLGKMPGWWFTIESTSSKHVINQFKTAIEAALASSPSERAVMRAQARKLRFPVAVWKANIDQLHETAITLSRKKANSTKGFRATGKSCTGTASARLPFQPSLVYSSTGFVVPTSVPSGSPPSETSTCLDIPLDFSEAEPSVLSLGPNIGLGHLAKAIVCKPKLLQGVPVIYKNSSQSPPISNHRNALQLPQTYSPFREGYSTNRLVSIDHQSVYNNIMIRPISVTGVVSIIHLKESVSLRKLGDTSLYNISNIMSMDILEGITDEKPTDGDSIDGPMYCKNKGIEDVISKYLMTPGEVEAREEVSELASSGPPVGAKIEIDALDDIWLPFLGSSNVSVLPARLAGEKLTTGVSVSRNQSCIDPSAQQDLIPRSAQPAVSGRLDSLGMRSLRNIDDSTLTPVSLETVLRGMKDFTLRKAEPFFTDSTGYYFDIFWSRLEGLNSRSSEGPLCIEKYLVQSEKDWLNRMWGARMMEKQRGANSACLNHQSSRDSPVNPHYFEVSDSDDKDRSLLQQGCRPPTILKEFFLLRVGQWPLYSFFIAYGQILGVSSYHVHLLTGKVGQSDQEFYFMATIYTSTSVLWWVLFRMFKSIYVLAFPFLFYGLAFFVLGLANNAKTINVRDWVGNIATAFYSIASSSYWVYFSLNFANDRDVPVVTWSFRGCVIEGSQRLYLVLLWYWGSRVRTPSSSESESESSSLFHDPTLTKITMPLALLMWIVGIAIYTGLPGCFHQVPGQIPSFYKTILRRKIILWFFVMASIQNFFLALPFSHNWRYLWSSQHAPSWAVAILVLVFFIGVWALMLALFGALSNWHSWILPVFTVGLGAPRWGQILWSTSSIGSWLPWAGSPLSGALIGRGLWLWLGVLDAIQGVGFGMILMQTLTRLHIAFAMVGAQVLGSIASVLARASALPCSGPGSLYPNLAVDGPHGLRSAWFWLGLSLQLSICVGFFKFFRKEQLQKP